MKKNSLLIISFSKLDRDPRVFRQIKALVDCGEVFTIGLTDSGLPNARFFPVSLEMGMTRRILSHVWTKLIRKDYEGYYARSYGIPAVKELVRPLAFDLIIANDLDALPLACQLKGPRSKLLFDAHEFSIEQRNDRLSWRLLYRTYNHYLFTKYIGAVDRMITVAPGIADEYKKHCTQKPEVILNAPDYVDTVPSPPQANRIRLIHHGNAGPSRSLELMIQAMRWVGANVELNLMLVPGNQGRYLHWLKATAAHDSRIHFLDPVPMPSIIERIREFDIGVCFFPPANFNLAHVLPNKFFEFIQARLALLVGPSIEMAPFVRKYKLGLVTEDFSVRSLAEHINGLTASAVLRFKANSHLAARELSSTTEMTKLRRIAQEMLP